MKKTLHNQVSIKKLTLAGLFIAIAVVLKSYLAINLSFTRISLAWVPIITIGILLGPFIGGISGVLADIIGFLIYPAGAYFPGFTLAYALVGIIPGLLKKVVLQTKSIYYYLFNAGAVIILFLASVWALFYKEELILDQGMLRFNTNFFLKVEPNFVDVTILYYLITATILAFLILIPIILKRIFNHSNFIFPLERILFIVTVTCVVSSLIIDTWAVSMVTGLPIIALLPKRIFTNFFTIPIYTYLVAVLITSFNKMIKNNNL